MISVMLYFWKQRFTHLTEELTQVRRWVVVFQEGSNGLRTHTHTQRVRGIFPYRISYLPWLTASSVAVGSQVQECCKTAHRWATQTSQRWTPLLYPHAAIWTSTGTIQNTQIHKCYKQKYTRGIYILLQNNRRPKSVVLIIHQPNNRY